MCFISLNYIHMNRNQIKKRYSLLENVYNKSDFFWEKQKNILYMISGLFFVVFWSLALLWATVLFFYWLLSFVLIYEVSLFFVYIILISLAISIPFYVLLGTRDYLHILVLWLKDKMVDKRSWEWETDVNIAYDISKMSKFKFGFVYGITQFFIVAMQVVFILLLLLWLILLVTNRSNIVDSISLKFIWAIIIILLIFILVKLNRRK